MFNAGSTTEEPYYDDKYCDKVVQEKIPLNIPNKDEKLYPVLEEYCKQVKVILHTVNGNEKWAVMEEFSSPQSDVFKGLESSPRKCITFPTINTVLGTFGGFKAAVVQTDSGYGCRDDIEHAMRTVFPNALVVIGIGVAYGADKCKLADVIISDMVQDLGTNVKIQGNLLHRGEKLAPKSKLKALFTKDTKPFTVTTEFVCNKGQPQRKPTINTGLILSGPWLCNDAIFKEKVFHHASDAIGGEMEGWVLMSVAKKFNEEPPHRNIGMIIIKGVADYGDGTKNKIWQFTAAKAAVCYAKYQLEKLGGNEDELK